MPLLELTKINKNFGGVQALNDVSLTINEGEIYGLIGPNGAGKTTLFNVITGVYLPNKGVSLLCKRTDKEEAANRSETK